MKTLERIKTAYHRNNVNLYHLYVFISGYIRSLKPEKYTMNEPIDFVVTWVDGNDPEWRAEKEKYYKMIHPEHDGNGEERYRDWGLFRYWFRSVEKYAPWVRNVYLVTCGHVPEWINHDCPKLKIVKHSDYIDEKYLPTFSSIPIELNLHRIEGLSEHFVYFNDDMFLAAPVEPTDFFGNGLPRLCAIAEPIRNCAEDRHLAHQRLSVAGKINEYFDPQVFIPQHPEKWFSNKIKKNIRYNKRALKDGYIPGFWFSHLAAPMRKSTLQKVWGALWADLDSTCQNRFRTPRDTMHQIFAAWEMVEGTFVPASREFFGVGYNQMDKKIDAIRYKFHGGKERIICLNDNKQMTNYEEIGADLQSILSSIFCEESEFEK